jgi:hypothetical protein
MSLKLSLAEGHLNRLLQPAGAIYQEGCFVLHRKLPLGAASLVAVPTLEGNELVLVLPFDQIRGDLTGGLMGQLAKMLWGVISDQVLKQAGPRLVAMGLPSDTLTVDQVSFQGKKAGRIGISLFRLNEWLARQKWVDPLHLSVEKLSFERSAVGVTLGLN